MVQYPKVKQKITFHYTPEDKVEAKYRIIQLRSKVTSLLFSRTYITLCGSGFCLGESFHNIPLLMYNLYTNQCTQKQMHTDSSHNSAGLRSGLGHHWAQLKYSHIFSFSSSLCPTVFVIILQLKLCMLSPVWCASLLLFCSPPLRNFLSAALLLPVLDSPSVPPPEG